MLTALKTTIASAVAVVLMQAAAPAQAQDIRVGALYPLSGSLALLGDESFRGLEVAVEMRNAAGGVNGKKIRLIKGDAVDTNQAVGEARRLISVEKVEAIIGTYSSALSFAASQVAELAGVPYFEMGAISDPITERGFKYLFRTAPTATAFGHGTVDAIVSEIAPRLKVDPKAMKIAIIHEDSLFGSTVAGVQKARAQQVGLNVVDIMPYSAKVIDLSSVVLRLKSAGVDVVLQNSYHNDTVLFFRQMNEAGYKPKAIIGTGGYSLTDTVAAIGAENFEGAMTVDLTQFAINPKVIPGASEFAAAYEKKYGIFPRSGHSLANYMGAIVAMDMFQAAGSMDKDKIRAAGLKIDIQPNMTPTGWGVKFAESGQNERAKPFLVQWQSGKLVTVAPVEAAIAEMKIGVGKQ